MSPRLAMLQLNNLMPFANNFLCLLAMQLKLFLTSVNVAFLSCYMQQFTYLNRNTDNASQCVTPVINGGI